MRRRGVGAIYWLAGLLAAGWLGCGKQAASPRVPKGAAGFPVEVVDAQGVKVRLEAPPERIVSTGPVVTETLFAVGAGDRVVAVSDQCNYPPEAARLPHIGGFFSPSVEKALAAKPDLVVGTRGNPPDFISALRGAGCPVFTVDPRTLDDIFRMIRDIARLVGRQERGEQVVGEMRRRLEAVAARVADVPDTQRPTAFIFLQLEPIWTAGAGTFQDELLRAAGARNAAGRAQGFTAYSPEALVAANPDYLILSTMAGDPQYMVREITTHPVYRNLYAVKKGNLVLLDADVLMRPGPRVVEAVEALARAFYPDRFPGGRPSSSATSAR